MGQEGNFPDRNCHAAGAIPMASVLPSPCVVLPLEQGTPSLKKRIPAIPVGNGGDFVNTEEMGPYLL